MFKKAEKSNLKLRMAISGASGSGKTYSSLSIASHLGGRIALIDTERGSASKYADIFDFDTCELTNHHPAKYIEAIQSAEGMGYDIIVIDSLSHAWFSELELAGSKFDGWKNVRPLERKLIDAMISSKCHIIATMRAKTEYIMEEYTKDGKVKKAPKKIGTAPIQTSGIEYEFDVAGEMDWNHILAISKTRCPSLNSRNFLNPGKDFAHEIKAWLNSNVAQKIQPQANVADTATGELTYPEHNSTIREIRMMLGTDTKALIEQLKSEFLVGEPQYIHPDQLPNLIRWMGSEWAKEMALYPKQAVNSYDESISNLMQHGLPIVEAIRQWKEHVEGQLETEDVY